jgi:hypothetical protein
VKDPGAHDLTRPALNAALANPPGNPPGDPAAALHGSLLPGLKGTAAAGNPPDGTQHSFRRILRQLLPGPTYPNYLCNTDRANFENYWRYINALNVPVHDPADAQKNASPTLLSISQKTYDAEVTRRESVNSRCSAVLNTAGILGALVVAAGQIGLMLHDRPISGAAWPVLIFFLISLAYLGYSVIIALQVHGAIQGEVIDAYDLWADNPNGLTIDKYNLNIAKTELLYANYNWCLNNEFKYRLQSAQRALRNGVIAVILAGAVSPWAVSSSAGGASGLPQTTSVVSSHATAHIY